MYKEKLINPQKQDNIIMSKTHSRQQAIMIDNNSKWLPEAHS